MKRLINPLVGLSFILLAGANIYIFVSGYALGQGINHYEVEIARLHSENIKLEKKVYEISSLNNVASVAAELDFTKNSNPLYIEELPFARR